MIVVEDLLQPISEDKPSGVDLRYDPIYDTIKEARRADDELNQGAWQTERKVADYPQVIALTTKALRSALPIARAPRIWTRRRPRTW